MEFDVGARLRSLREKHSLSQRQLAQRAGVTNGTISLIEQNRSSPSVASLRKVLQGIPITLAEFFGDDEHSSAEQIFFRPADLLELTSKIADARKGKISFRQVGDLRNRNLQILHERYEPGADTGSQPHMLQHESEEGGVVIKGQIELTVGTQSQILGPGDAYFFDSRLPHRFRNVGNEDCELISACTPPYL
ncbi:MAG TPA: cupin domain-containing protein [Candidatus Sulfotelmatobacter sp.]|jgi:transcriptional regulator with XRE-family HTH domain|nr:cupin domain-containing protein [Candidatus Sulfotelmatobacter sp.]